MLCAAFHVGVSVSDVVVIVVWVGFKKNVHLAQKEANKQNRHFDVRLGRFDPTISRYN